MMKTTLQSVLCVLVLSFMLVSQSLSGQGAACAEAQTIRCGTNLNNQTNSGGTNDLEVYSCTGRSTLTGYNGKERVYELVVNVRQEYDILLDDVRDPELNFDLFLIRANCTTGDCVYASTNDDNSPERILEELNPGTYYLVVDTWADEIGRYDLSVTCGPSPILTSCEGARPLWCDELISGNTWGQPSNFSSALYNCYGGTGTFNGGDVVYSFTKRRASDHINLHLFTEARNLNIFLASRCDDQGFSCMAAGKEFEGGKFIDEEDIGLPAGQYYVIVDGRNSATDGAYSILLSCDEFNFSQAQELTCGRPLERQSFTGGTNQATLYACNDANQTVYDGVERLYYFDVVDVTTVTLKLDKTSTFGELGLFLFEAGTNSPVCLEAGKKINNGDFEIEIPLNRGRYYVVVDNRKEGFFDLSLTGCDCPVDATLKCDEPIMASNAGGGDDVRYSEGACTNYPLRLDAQDRVYEFVAPETQTYSFRLSDLEKDLGLFLFENCNDPETCIGFSNKRGDDQVDIFLEEDQIVYVAVDGVARLVTSNFKLEVICTPTIEDRDGDGVSDADDNCPDDANADQANFDNDGIGDVCDNDDDNDGVADGVDCNPLNASIAFSIGDICDDGDDDTINDTINGDCTCVGVPRADQDVDGVFDEDDNCPSISNPDQEDFDNDLLGDACDDDDDGDGVLDDVDCDPRDATIAFSVGDTCDDGDPDTSNDRINNNCECAGDLGAGPLQLTVGSGTGSPGDTVCVDIVATEFTDVSSASFSVTLDGDLAKIISISNQALTGGAFTGSGCAVVDTRTGSLSGGFVVWTSDPGQSLSLGPVTPIVEVCAEILPGGTAKSTIAITDLIRDVEFFDSNADEIPFILGDGQICREASTTNNATMQISGNVMNIAEVGMSEVALDLSGDMTMTTMSDAQGAYALDVSEGGDFGLTPRAIDEIMEGVSVLDVLLFRQHFIFKRSFDNPYQYIAADIDGNGRLSVRDEQLMKMRILGLGGTEYPLWRFVPADHVFPEVEDFATGGPIFEYPQHVDISELSGDMTQDFIGIRMGDLQLSDLLAENRSATASTLSTDEKTFTTGQLVNVPLRLKRDMVMAGLSIELDFDASVLDLVDVRTELAGELEDMVVMRFVEDGKLIIQWVGDEAEQISSDEELFELTFRTNASGILSQHMSLNNVLRPSEVIDTRLELSDLTLSFEKEEIASLTIFPNPVADVATLQFSNIADASVGQMNIYNLNGQRLLQKDIAITRGANFLEIRKEEIRINNGVVLVEINTGSQLLRSTLVFVR